MVRSIRESISAFIPRTTRAWLVVHVGVPLLPCIVGSFIRFLGCDSLSIAVLDPSELAVSLSIVSALVRRSLLESDGLVNPDDQAERLQFATYCQFPRYSLLALFGIIEFISVSPTSAVALESKLGRLNWAVIFSAVASLIFFIITQRTFKLKVG